ncbi:peptidase M24 [Candidatus Epulonipiscioides gigas]|nr:peptidase M24 [Epulopiscium sp. SCG-C07WGA-EpuloA2]
MNRLEQLRKVMKEKSIDIYYIPSADFHSSEYVGDYFKTRKYISNFTGSAGELVITQNEAVLFTDGRYFIQAEIQLKDTGITLLKIGEPDVPKLPEYIRTKINEGEVLGFDGRVVGVKTGLELKKIVEEKKATIKYNEDLVNIFWKDRPNLPIGTAFLLDDKYTGESVSSKLMCLRKTMEQYGAQSHIITTLDDIAWLYNIRGNDIPHFPVILAYTIVTLDKAYLFVDNTKLSNKIIEKFSTDNIEIKQYNEIYNFVKTLSGAVLIDPQKINYALYFNIPENIVKIEKPAPTILFKARKNKIELENIRKAHIKDGVAVTKFMYWLKNTIKTSAITELDAKEKIFSLRSEQENFIEESFDTISAYGKNAAFMHYSTDPKNPVLLENKGFYLIDSGGQYFEGTTDITRTIALGELNDTLKTHFTAVLRGVINLSRAKFLEGVRGINLDILARGPIWELDIDYRSGTGHGIGYLLNVHEAPNGIRWKIVPERNDSCILEVGMVTSNEPGIYIENSHGIRTENEIVVQEDVKNEYGQFLKFETITFAPIDIEAIKVEMLTKQERAWINEYHKNVYEKIAPYLTKPEQEWLKTYTQEI